MSTPAEMSMLERFAFSFLNPEVAARYVRPILEGMVITIELGLLIIATGLKQGQQTERLLSSQSASNEMLAIGFH